MAAAVEVAVRGTALVYALAEGASVTVGRVVQCEIHIDDQAVSRRHCTLAVQGTAILVTDLDSANGTFLNERPVKISRGAAGRSDSRGFDRSSSTAIRTPCGGGVGTARVAAEADREMESVIRRRIEPAEMDWLSSADVGVAGAGAAAARAAASQDAASGLGGAGRCARSPSACGRRARDDPRRDRRRPRSARAAPRRHDDRGGRRRRGAAQESLDRARSR